MSILQLISCFFCALIFGQLTAHFARKRGRDPRFWFFFGALFGLLGILAVFLFPAKRIAQPLPKFPCKPKSDSWLKHWYFLDSQRKQNGPLEFPQFIQAWKKKEFSPSSLIWGEGMEKWTKIEDMPELIHEIEHN